jgi:hypothetical protein
MPKNKKYWLVVKFSNIDQFEDGITKLLTNIDFYVDISTKSRQYVEKNRWLDDHVGKVLDIFIK